MREKHWSAVEPRAFTLDGTNEGLLTVASTRCIFVKQRVIIQSDTQSAKPFEVKRVHSETELVVGPAGHIDNFEDMTAYLAADNAFLYAKEQPRNSIPDKEHERAVFAEEPIVAKRVIAVDKLGRTYEEDNPFPVQLSDGSIDIGTVNAELEVQLSHQDNTPNAGDVADSVQIGDGTDILEINADGSINVKQEIEYTNNEGVSIVNIPTPGSEVNFTFPDGLKYYKINVRDSKDVIKLGLSAGDISAGNYWTIKRGNQEEPSNFHDFPDSYTLYFESKTKSNVELEIHYFYKV